MKKFFNNLSQRKFLKLLLFSSIGFIGGYLYYYFIGCYSGGCPITAKWYTSSLYGMLIGAIAGFPSFDKKSSSKENE